MTTDVSTDKLKINVLTRTQYDATTKNNDELYFVEESETNTWLNADTAPASATVNDRYYNSLTKLIYTWDGSTWTNSISPSSDDLYIDKTDNSTYAWNGTDLIQIGSAGGITSDDIDDVTITLNASDKLQASGVINQNSGTIYNWVGTKNEYDALQEIHNDWLYYITDDEYSSGNMSMSNVYNRLNRAYAWTYRNVNGAGNAYNIGYYGGSFFTSDAFPATEVIMSEEAFSRSNYMICDGKLYRYYQSNNTFTREQIGTDTTWTYIAGLDSNNNTYAINNGDLYYINYSTITLKDSGGWQKLSLIPNSGWKSLGIKNDNLYMIYDGTHSLIDSSGVWTHITGSISSSYSYLFGIKDGKLYAISFSGVINEISSETGWTSVKTVLSGTIAYAIKNGNLYIVNNTGVNLVNNTETWKKISYNMCITETGKLYTCTTNYSNPVLTQIGTDTTWSDISGYDTNSIGVNNGNVYCNLTGTQTQLTTSGGISKVYGMAINNTSYSSAAYWTGSVTEDVHTVYTIPSPQTGYHTYADENLEPVSTITAVNMNNNTITDGLYTYTRDSAADKVFTAVSPDSSNQLVSMADLLNAIKG